MQLEKVHQARVLVTVEVRFIAFVIFFLLISFIFGSLLGPLMYYYESKWFIVGIVSFVIVKSDECDSSRPSYHTKMFQYLTWMENGIRIIESSLIHPSSAKSHQNISCQNVILISFLLILASFARS